MRAAAGLMRLTAQHPTDLKAVYAGEHDVQDDQVRALATGRLHSLPAVGSRHDPIPLPLQVVLQGLQEDGFVFYDQDGLQRNPSNESYPLFGEGAGFLQRGRADGDGEAAVQGAQPGP